MISSQVPTPAELQADYNAAKALGSPMIASNAALVPEGFSDLRLLIAGFTRPILSANDPAEVNYAGGLAAHVTATLKTAYQMSVTILETEAGIVQDFSDYLNANGGQINCWAYDGRPERWTRRYFLRDCIFTFDGAGDMQSDSRSQVVTVQATMNYVYFGQVESLGGGVSFSSGRTEVAISAQNKRGSINIRGLIG